VLACQAHGLSGTADLRSASPPVEVLSQALLCPSRSSGWMWRLDSAGQFAHWDSEPGNAVYQPGDHEAAATTASTFGHTLPNLLSDIIGPGTLRHHLWHFSPRLDPIRTLVPLLVVAILYGFFSGALISLPVSAVARITRDMSMFGARIGLVFAFMNVGSLVSTPVTGAVLERQCGGYDCARI
jgi:hypothetical protein